MNKFLIKRNNRKFMLVIALIVLALLTMAFNISYVIAEEHNSKNTEIQIMQVVDNLLFNIDLSELDAIVQEIDSAELFDISLKDKISQIISGKYFDNYSSIYSGILSIFLIDVREFLPLLFMIIAIGLLSGMLNELKSSSDRTNDVIHFVCMSVMVVTIMFVFKDVLQLVSSTLNILLKQMKIIFPILITLMTSIGSFSTISIYNPLVAVLTTIVSFVFEKLLFPIFIVVFIFAILGNLTDTVKLNRFQGFMTSLFKWVVGIVFTLFTGFLSIQGISAGKYDSVSIKATKFAVKSYIPIIGSYISEGMDFLVLGSVLVKNTIGLVGFFVAFLTIVSPVVSILVVKFGFQLCSAILEMCGNKKFSDFTASCSKLLVMPIVIILGVSFMYLITVALIMCTANIF